MTQSPQITGHSSINALRILIAEDNWAERTRLKTILKRLGYDVVEALDGITGLEMFRAAQPDIVISDWIMPGADGLTFCKALQQDTESPPYFVMLTGRHAPADIVASLDAGADDFISKPVNHEELRARLDAASRRLSRSMPPARQA